jgi:hypothetical protein
MKTKMSSSKTQATLLSGALAAAVLALNAHATSLESLATAPEAQENTARRPVQQGIEDSQSILSQAENLARTQGLQVVYHGSQQLKDQLGRGMSESVLQLDSDNQVIITDSLDKDLAMQLLGRGNFVVMVGSIPSNPAKSAMSMLHDLAETGHLQKSKAAYDVDQARMTADTGDGKFVEENVSAYFYSPSGSGSFHAVERNPVAGVAKAIQWARDEVMTSGSPTGRQFAKNWQTAAYTRNTTNSCYSGATFVADTSFRTSYSKLSETNGTYDYWAVKYTTQMVPNYANTTYRWRNDWNVISADANANNSSWVLLDYSPSTTPAGSSAISVGLDSSGIASIGWSYSAFDTSVTDQSAFGSQLAKWQHNINEYSSSGTNTLKVDPGALFRVHNGATSVWTRFSEKIDAVYVSYTGGITERYICRATWN